MSIGDVPWLFVVSGLGAKIPDPWKNWGLVFGTVWANPTPLKRDLHGEPEMYSKYWPFPNYGVSIEKNKGKEIKNELRVYTIHFMYMYFVVIGASDCENFRFEYRVVVTLLGCAGFIMLAGYELVLTGCWGDLLGSTDTYSCCTCGGTFVWSCRILLRRVWVWGYLWSSKSYTVTVAWLWEVFQIVYSSTGFDL